MALWMIPAATALLGARNAQAKRDQQQRYNKGQAEVTRFSPWTGMTGQMDNSYSPDALSGAIGGGLQGVGLMQGLQGLGGGANPAQPTADQFSQQVDLNQRMGLGQQTNMNMQPNLYGSSWNIS